MSDNLSYSSLRELSMLTKAPSDGKISNDYHERRRAEILTAVSPKQARAAQVATELHKAVEGYVKEAFGALAARVSALETEVAELRQKSAQPEAKAEGDPRWLKAV